MRSKVSDESVVAAYVATGSVWRAAERIGLCGQSVHERLLRLGIRLRNPRFTESDRDHLRRTYSAAADVGNARNLAVEFGRSPQFLCRMAGALGLTEQSRPRSYISEDSRARLLAWHRHNVHPRGMLGKRHTPEFVVAFRARMMERRMSMTREQRQDEVAASEAHGQRSWQAGWREFGGKRRFYRSRWEANYGRYLEWLKGHGVIAEWEHEPHTFWFKGIKRGAVSYLPDFRVIDRNGDESYHEVKGWFDKRSKTKIRRMRKYFPKIPLIVVDRARYQLIKVRASSRIDGWEFDQRVVRSAKAVSE